MQRLKKYKVPIPSISFSLCIYVQACDWHYNFEMAALKRRESFGMIIPLPCVLFHNNFSFKKLTLCYQYTPLNWGKTTPLGKASQTKLSREVEGMFLAIHHKTNQERGRSLNDQQHMINTSELHRLMEWCCSDLVHISHRAFPMKDMMKDLLPEHSSSNESKEDHQIKQSHAPPTGRQRENEAQAVISAHPISRKILFKDEKGQKRKLT